MDPRPFKAVKGDVDDDISSRSSRSSSMSVAARTAQLSERDKDLLEIGKTLITEVNSKRIQSLFEKLDTNKDGKLDQKDFNHRVQKVDSFLQDVWKFIQNNCDVNEDGSVSNDEFVLGLLVNTWLFAYAPRIEGANFGDQLEAWDMNLNTGLAEQLQQWEDDILSVDPEGGMSVKIGSRQSSLSPPNSPSQGSGAGSLSLGYSNDGRISPFGRKRPLPSNGEIPSMLGFSPLPPSSFSPPSPPPSPSLQSHFSMPPRFYKATQENEFKDAVEKEYHLMQVFQKYDVDGNGRMDPAEFTKLVSDLLVIRDVHLIPTQEKLNEIARVVASLLLDAPTSVRKQFIDIHDFVDAGTKPGKISSFNHYITGGSPQPPQNLKIGDHLFYNAADGASEPGSSIATLWEPVTIIDVQQLYDGPVYTIHFLDKPPLTVERRTLRRQNQVGLLDTLLSAELLRDVYPHKLDKLKLCCSTRPKAVGFITYDEAELDFGLQLIFYKHDLDANGVLDWEEFIDMVRYLFVAQAGGCSAGGGGAVLHFTDTQVESAAHAIASHSAHLSPVFRPLAAIKIHDFLAAAKRQPSPFDETVSVGMPALAQALEKEAVQLTIEYWRTKYSR